MAQCDEGGKRGCEVTFAAQLFFSCQPSIQFQFDLLTKLANRGRLGVLAICNGNGDNSLRFLRLWLLFFFMMTDRQNLSLRITHRIDERSHGR